MLVPNKYSVLSMTPARGRVEFKTDDVTWSEPLVGWGIVVGWRSLDDDRSFSSPRLADGDVEYDSAVEPMILVEGRFVNSLWEYCREHELGAECDVKVVLE